VIEAEDGVEFSCHKCILVSRLGMSSLVALDIDTLGSFYFFLRILEYFAMMLTAGWLEVIGLLTVYTIKFVFGRKFIVFSFLQSSEEFFRLKMPIPSRVLKVIIEFLYTDEAPSVKGNEYPHKHSPCM
jgi:hypothetical protein